jgi:rhodanese-related sulfurtransferase
MNTPSRGLALAACTVALVLPGVLAGCSSDPTTTSASAETGRAGGPIRVGVAEFAKLAGSPGVQIIDVRTPEEFADGHIEGAVNIPVQGRDFDARVAGLDPNGTYAVYCRSGNRSQPAVAAMHSAGIRTVYELDSGTRGWTSKGRPLVQ